MLTKLEAKFFFIVKFINAVFVWEAFETFLCVLLTKSRLE
jgi:hypothetical protein